MPTYSYKCTECDWSGDIRCAADYRDAQTCDNEVDVEVVDNATDETVTIRDRCRAPLEREEIPMSQGKMSYNWSKWQS